MDSYIEKFDFSNLEPDLLSAFLQDRKMWVDFKDHIEESYFNNKDVSKVFKMLRLYFNKYKDFPTKKQIVSIGKKAGYEQDVFKIVDDIFERSPLNVSEISFLRDETGEFIQTNKIDRAILKAVELREDREYHKIKDLIVDAVHWNPDVNLGTNYADAEIRYAKLHHLMTHIVQSPWDSLNQYIGGGFYKKELYIFAASSSVGKSIALDQIALHAWKNLGLNVVMITFEMSEERKGQRMDACNFGIPVQEVFNKKETIIKSFESKFKDKPNFLFIKEMPQTYNTSHIEQYLYQLQLYKNIQHVDLLLVDYMDIMSPRRRKTGKDYEDQGTVGADLRDMGKIYEIPVVSASQFNRDALDMTIEELHEGKIADSWKKIMIGDGVIAMANTPEERMNGRINFKGVKNRNGIKDFIIPMRIVYEQLKIIDTKEINSERAKQKIDERKKKNRPTPKTDNSQN